MYLPNFILISECKSKCFKGPETCCTSVCGKVIHSPVNRSSLNSFTSLNLTHHYPSNIFLLIIAVLELYMKNLMCRLQLSLYLQIPGQTGWINRSAWFSLTNFVSKYLITLRLCFKTYMSQYLIWFTYLFKELLCISSPHYIHITYFTQTMRCGWTQKTEWNLHLQDTHKTMWPGIAGNGYSV